MRRSQKYRGGRGMDQYAVATPAPDPVNQELVRAERAYCACPGEDQFYGMTPCRLVIIYSRFGGAFCLHIQDSTNQLQTNTASYPTTHRRSIFPKCCSWLYNKHNVLCPKYISGKQCMLLTFFYMFSHPSNNYATGQNVVTFIQLNLLSFILTLGR